ncbi:hypothetical protein C7M84_010393 [Penaeus vannamei]|uniref:C2H2-type domain-containing protein n=1 Tax=Penaeus vannamei TaxID=6689 RepID=A0A3R7MAA0_PENVA|nr:hypothetical protein C7M84_010393 [Penaeus vannamei]
MRMKAQMPLSPSGQYFIQTPDGQIIQVLGSLDDESIQAEPILGESQASEADEGRARSENIVAVGETERNMQIFVVGGNSGEEVYLINAPEREIGDSDQGSALPVSAMMLKDVEASSAQADLTTGKLPADLEAKAGEAENLLTVSLQGENQSLKNSFLDTLPKVPLEKDSLDIQISQPQIQGQVSKPRTALPFAKSLSLMQSPLELLTEGMRVQTDRGEMMAFNLSSVTQAKQMGLHGQKSLKNIASLFGSVVKVLRPVAEEKKQEVLEIKDRPILLSCNECGALLHSERSLQIHIRRYHEEWQDECSLCGEKFYSASYVRSHIQKVHSQDASFQCRLCSYESNELKAIIKHQKVHGKCQSCEKCGKKYKTPKVFRAHVMNCKGSLKMESRVPSKRKGTQVSTSSDDSSQRDGDTDVGVHEVSGEPQAKHQKIEVNVTENREVSSLETYSPTKTVQTKRRYGKVCQAEEGVKKKDAEFKPTSKHYHQQILKMTVEQRPTRHSARGRDRTHRCYLCFKLFSTANELDAHKESYHQVKSARPVRVRTDASLEEEEEDFASTTSVNIKSSHTQSHEDVVIKEEPLEFAEEYENVTIILDDVMKSTHVVKPLCIACKAVTNTDYRKSSKWFSKVPDDDHSEALKRFEQFFPCAIDPKKLMVPWLYAKCVLLIDKIADMEEKLNSMKSDLMLRFRGSDKDTSDNLNDLPQSDLSENVSSLSADNTGLPGQGDLAEGIGKSLADIEAYMKDTCEIMEITKLRKRPGRPRRQQAEKLTPVIVSGDEEEEPTSMNEVVKIVAKGLKKETKASSVEVTCKNWNDRKGSTEVSQKDAEENCLPRVKEEPIHDGFEDIIPGPDSSSWDEIGSNSLACLTNLQEEDFLIGSTKVRKGGDSTSQLFTDQNSSIDSSATEASQDAEHLGQTSEKPLDNDATDQGSNKLKPEQRLEDMSLEKKPDMPLVFETGDSSESQCSKSRDKETEQNLRNFMGALEEAANDLVKNRVKTPEYRYGKRCPKH